MIDYKNWSFHSRWLDGARSVDFFFCQSNRETRINDRSKFEILRFFSISFCFLFVSLDRIDDDNSSNSSSNREPDTYVLPCV